MTEPIPVAIAELVRQGRAAGVKIGGVVEGRLQLRAPQRAADLVRALRAREAEVLTLMAPGRRCHCGAVLGVRLYVSGLRCPEHTPAALAGRPEPDGHNLPPGGLYRYPNQRYSGTQPGRAHD